VPLQLPRQRLHVTLLGLLQRFPWFGWAIWIVIVVAVLLRMHPRRYGAAFGYYFDFALSLWAEEPVYDPSKLAGVSYWPSSVLMFIPLARFGETPAAAISFAIFAALLTWAAVALVRALLDDRPGAIWIAGLLLAVNALPGWYHFKHVQLQIPMVAAMMLAAAALMRERYSLSAFWLTIALILKPISLVMLSLTAATVPRMRVQLIAGMLIAAALPFAFLHWHYLIGQYQELGMKLWTVTTAPPGEWIYQADFTTLLRAAGIVLPGKVTFVIRLAVALGTLWLAWRVRETGDRKAFALALLTLSGLFITLFGPRNENVSYLAVTPAISAVAFLMILRNAADLRGWVLIAACQALGYVVSVPIDVVTKPAIMVVIYIWFAALMVEPGRWCALMPAALPRPDADAAPATAAKAAS
jgi:hypothetical protein